MITLDQFYMGRDKKYANELTPEIKTNAVELLSRVNAMLNELSALTGMDFSHIVVSSGWRPASINANTPGAAKKSLHMVGKAVDIEDARHALYPAILAHSDLLHKYSLWLESNVSAPTWCHLDMSDARVDRNVRTFMA